MRLCGTRVACEYPKFRNTELPAMPAVEPVLRALNILEELNLSATTSLAALARATGLPKPTLVRLLDTLIAGGYARRVSRRDGYALTERVVRLSGGFRHADAVVEAARPFLSALTAEHKWPVALATLDHDAMLLRASTLKESPFGTDPNQLNRHVPMLVSALGRAYLAFCPDVERETILALLRASPLEANRPARDPRHIRDLIRTVRRQGYASTGPIPGDRSKGLAIPVLAGSRVLAAITLRYIGVALSEDEAVKRYLPSLRAAARRIAQAALA
jgi:IclR family mhp operon transcriptional activator